MKITAFLRPSSHRQEAAHVFFRVRDGQTDIKAVSELTIAPRHWCQQRQGYKARVTTVDETERTAFDKAVQDLKSCISRLYYRGADGEWLRSVIEDFHHPHIHDGRSSGIVRLTEEYESFLAETPMAAATRETHRYVLDVVARYERYARQVVGRSGYALWIDRLSADDLTALQCYLRDEHVLIALHPDFFGGEEMRLKARPRSAHTIMNYLCHLRTLHRWCVKRGRAEGNPFEGIDLKAGDYGTPFYLTLEERDAVYAADLSAEPQLAVYRDVFVLHCLLGCRVGDFERLTRRNIVGDAIEYVPQKTRSHHPASVRVPLTAKALAIIGRYAGEGERLVPRVERSTYGRNIRRVLRVVGIDRRVAWVDPVTQVVMLRPLWEVATTHTARKTFVGNLYKRVKDPSIISAMSGHAEGSRSFQRYREIDDDIKREVLRMIE